MTHKSDVPTQDQRDNHLGSSFENFLPDQPAVMPLKKKRDKAALEQPSTRRSKKRDFQPTLFIHGVGYEFGLDCGYCASDKAVFHCRDCPEFLCVTCEQKIHAHKKHEHHVRHKLSKYDIEGAAHVIKGFFGFLLARKLLRSHCRQAFIRYYDPNSRQYYYFNKKTRETQWEKPLCLKGDTDLAPPLSEAAAAHRIAGFFRGQRARRVLRDRSHALYERVFDPSTKRCFYRFKGRSRLLQKVRWDKPVFLYAQEDIQLKLTPPVAAMRIQYAWRRWLIKRLLRCLLRANYKRVLDPIMQTYCYWAPDGTYLRRQPYALGGERWEINDMMQWTTGEVKVFLRRLKLKQYLSVVDDYGLDGALMLACEDLDYRLMGITCPLHIKKIKRAIEQTHEPGEDALSGASEFDVWARRKQIRLLYEQGKGAKVIQRNVRRYLAQGFVRQMRVRGAALRSRKAVQDQIAPKGMWYTDLNMPLTDGVKAFGTRRPMRTAQGWGHWSGSQWKPLNLSREDILSLKGAEIDAHDSHFWIAKLNDLDRTRERQA